MGDVTGSWMGKGQKLSGPHATLLNNRRKKMKELLGVLEDWLIAMVFYFPNKDWRFRYKLRRFARHVGELHRDLKRQIEYDKKCG